MLLRTKILLRMKQFFQTIIVTQLDWKFQAAAVPNYIHTVHTLLNLPIGAF